MTDTIRILPPEAWKPNQKVILENAEGRLSVIADQARSTPGVIVKVPVEAGCAYRLDLKAVANCSVQVYLIEDGKKQQPSGPINLPRHVGKVSFEFYGPKNGLARIGILFSSSSLETSGDPHGSTFEIISASLKCFPRRSGTVASMATMPSRAHKLPATVTSILGQVDHLFVHLNGFDRVPDVLNKPEITVSRSQNYGDLKDTGKFLNLRDVDDNAYVFTIDDDIVYPANYVSRMRDCLKRFDDKVVAGVHGVIYPPRPVGFFERLVLHFMREFPIDMPVSCLGTGTTAFKLGTLRPNVDDFSRHGMADLFFAGLAKQAGVPLISVARPENWLVEIAATDELDDSLFQETRKDNGPHLKTLLQFGPWGYDPIREALAKKWGSEEAAPLHIAARQFLNFMSWIEHGCEGLRPEVVATPETISLASRLKMPVLLREMIYG